MHRLLRATAIDHDAFSLLALLLGQGSYLQEDDSLYNDSFSLFYDSS
jgi:hypothetical protein